MIQGYPYFRKPPHAQLFTSSRLGAVPSFLWKRPGKVAQLLTGSLKRPGRRQLSTSFQARKRWPQTAHTTNQPNKPAIFHLSIISIPFFNDSCLLPHHFSRFNYHTSLVLFGAAEVPPASNCQVQEMGPFEVQPGGDSTQHYSIYARTVRWC